MGGEGEKKKKAYFYGGKITVLLVIKISIMSVNVSMENIAGNEVLYRERATFNLPGYIFK